MSEHKKPKKPVDPWDAAFKHADKTGSLQPLANLIRSRLPMDASVMDRLADLIEENDLELIPPGPLERR